MKAKHIYSFWSDRFSLTRLYMEEGHSNDRAMALTRAKMRELLPELPGVNLMVEDQSGGRHRHGGGGKSIAFQLVGEDSGVLSELADGYFVIPYTIGNYLADKGAGFSGTDHPEYGIAVEGINDKINSILSVKGKSSVDEIHRKLGLLMWENCGMAREDAGLRKALEEMPAIAEEFKTSVNVPGAPGEFNQTLVKALRLADFLEFGELMVRDALERSESCGGHFRLESQTEEGEALRDDENFAHVSAALFVSAKISQLALLPQGQPERHTWGAEDGGADG